MHAVITTAKAAVSQRENSIRPALFIILGVRKLRHHETYLNLLRTRPARTGNRGGAAVR
jgi:hypothetical protein